jgi:hypothetical protein
VSRCSRRDSNAIDGDVSHRDDAKEQKRQPGFRVFVVMR